VETVYQSNSERKHRNAGTPPEFPGELTARDQWTCWKRVPRGEKLTKIPINARTGYMASTTDADTWSPLEIAQARMRAVGEREELAGAAGYIFSEADPYTGIDFDNCLDLTTRRITDPEVAREVAELASYTEVSTSGTGLKVIVRATKPGPRCVNRAAGIEVYSHSRLFALTGAVFGGYRAIRGGPEVQAAVDAIYARAFPDDSEDTGEADEPRGEAGGPVSLDDRRLLKTARRSKTGREFRRLFDHGDASGYPSHSEADWQLMRHLAYWTGGDPERMAALFRQSALYRTSKGASYPERTARNRLRTYRGAFYRPQGEPEDAAATLEAMGFWRALMGNHWPRVSGPTKHNILAALALEATDRGRPRKGGSQVGVYMRESDLAQAAGCSVSSLRRNVPELRAARWLEVHRPYRRRAMLYVLKVPQTDRTESNTPYSVKDFSPVTLRDVGAVLRIRWATARYAAMQGVGKSGGILALHLLAAGEHGYTPGELAKLTGRRADNLLRNLRALAEHNLARETPEGRYRLPADFLARLQAELEARGLAEAERLAAAREEREAAAVEYLRTQRQPEESEPEPDATNAPDALLDVPRNVSEDIGEPEPVHTVDDEKRERLAVPRKAYRDERKWRRVWKLAAQGMRRGVAVREVFGPDSPEYARARAESERRRERACRDAERVRAGATA
jgi:hypothetical protein